MESGDGKRRHLFGNRLGGLRSVGAVPVRGPVQRAEKRARGYSIADERAHAALVPVAFGDDRGAQSCRQRVHFEMCGRTLDFVNETEDVRHGQVVEPGREGAPGAPRSVQCGEQPIERPVLTEEQQLVLAAEVVVQVRGRKVCRASDVAHAGRGEADGAEAAGGSSKNLDAARVGAPFAGRGTAGRTAVRKVNHRSILAEWFGVDSAVGSSGDANG